MLTNAVKLLKQLFRWLRPRRQHSLRPERALRPRRSRAEEYLTATAAYHH